MGDSMKTYRAWLDTLPDTDGFAWISEPRAFVHDDCRYERGAANRRALPTLLADGVPVLFHDLLNPKNDIGECGVRQASLEWAVAGSLGANVI